MKRFIKKFILFASVLFVVAVVVDLHISYYLKNSDVYTFRAWNNIYKGDLSNNVVINGNSRALFLYNPIILDTVLNVDSYNLGVDGNPIGTQIIKYNAYCKWNGHHPDLLIQNIDYSTIDDHIFRKEQLFPLFVYDRDLVFPFSKYMYFSFWEKYVPSYRYAGYDVTLCAFGLCKYYHSPDSRINQYDPLIKGYMERNLTFDGTYCHKCSCFHYSSDSASLKLFDDFIRDVIRSGTKILFVYAPTYIGLTNKIDNIDGMYEMYDTVAKKYNIPILDYSYDEICYDTNYFYNAMHLNKEGAELFSIKLAHDIDSLGILK